MEDIKVVNLKAEHIEAVIDMVVKSFLSLNQFWKEQKYEEVEPVFRARIQPALSSSLPSLVVLKGQKIIAAHIQF